jgi:1-acyl-sn-glycerol-3-phosphate acyltransferase
VVANHESQADPFLLSFLPWDMRWVAKEELFHQPLTGWAMRFGGDIPIRRGEGESVREMMNECQRALAGGISVMMFPEGTRSKGGELLPFRDGAFRLALAAGVPILPVALAGTRQMRPKHSKWFGKAHACAKILEPISTAGMGPDDVATLRDRARETIAAALPDLRSRYG